jgi:hypothetical protein
MAANLADHWAIDLVAATEFAQGAVKVGSTVV